EEIPYCSGSRIVAVELRRTRPAQCAELDAELHLLPVPAPEALPHQHLVVAHTVEVTGVEQRDSLIQSRVNGRDALRAVCPSIHVRHSHGSKTDRRYLRTVRPKLPLVHLELLSVICMMAPQGPGASRANKNSPVALKALPAASNCLEARCALKRR